ncbi:uncharacterized protein LOC127247275 [Andrographis paniculata]|uniref:uncharacterized protein LOC127247275 n=1 Tax=Andrographis paniculata TaxID=175694 RepID=UPI0021E94635|nr:uncharacterized protein LOC127247275 [Andrographis paniculata]XP_051125019.1 uncharacterized protein LOC127247275 [Andrographis paniculata]
MGDPEISGRNSDNKSAPPADKPTPKIQSAAGEYSRGSYYPNPPESVNPDSATLRDQWRFAIRQYSKWYSHAWGTAILAGLSFFALGWVIKGSNPLPSFKPDNTSVKDSDSASDGDVDKVAAEDHRSR